MQKIHTGAPQKGATSVCHCGAAIELDIIAGDPTWRHEYGWGTLCDVRAAILQYASPATGAVVRAA